MLMEVMITFILYYICIEVGEIFTVDSSSKPNGFSIGMTCFGDMFYTRSLRPDPLGMTYSGDRFSIFSL